MQSDLIYVDIWPFEAGLWLPKILMALVDHATVVSLMLKFLNNLLRARLQMVSCIRDVFM